MAALFVITKNWKQSKCVSAGKWTDRSCYTRHWNTTQKNHWDWGGTDGTVFVFIVVALEQLYAFVITHTKVHSEFYLNFKNEKEEFILNFL